MRKQKELDTQPKQMTLGDYLADIRTVKGMTLREVEEASNRDISNAYLSQLEKGHITKPRPNILHSLAEVYGIQYEVLMEKAGYIMSVGVRDPNAKHGRLATFADKNLTTEEEEELLKYLAFLRTKKARK